MARLSGRIGASERSVAVSDRTPAAELLLERVFSEGAVRSEARTLPLSRVDSELRGSGCDLTMIHTDRSSSERQFAGDYLRMPDNISVFLKTPDDLDALLRSSHSLKDDMRLVRRAGMQVLQEGREADFDLFYDRFYVPFISDRHGVLTRPRQKEWLKARLMAGGVLLWVLRDGEKISGVLVDPIDETLHVWALGTRDGDQTLMRQGALAAVYRFTVEFAMERGCSWMNFGLSRAFMSDGTLLFKRKWGMEMRPTHDNSGFFLIRWDQWNEAAARFLHAIPLVHQDGDRLTAIAATGLDGLAGQADADRLYKAVWMQGMHRCILVNSAGWEPGTQAPPGTTLVSGLSSAALLKQAT